MPKLFVSCLSVCVCVPVLKTSKKKQKEKKIAGV